MTGVVRFLAFGVLSFAFFALLLFSAKVLGGTRSRCPALTAGPRTSVRGSAVWGRDWKGVFVKRRKNPAAAMAHSGWMQLSKYI